VIKVDSFDKNVEKYESWFERNSAAYKSELEAVKALFPEHGKGLEIGVGTGLFAAPLGVRFGLDPSKNMSKAAMKRGVKVILGTGENMPCRDGSFDIVLMITTVCFLDDVVRTLNEAHRVLKNRGYIVIGFIDRESFLGRVYEIRKMDNKIRYGSPSWEFCKTGEPPSDLPSMADAKRTDPLSQR
jgi:ubiquinone/menaquinone biosynthesis C-methylase UbiE